jgi:protein SCO1/2
MLLTPDGRVSRYLFGLDYTPTDLRLALVETSAGLIGTPIDKILLRCYHYNSETGKYNLVVMNVVRIFGGVMTLGVAGLIALLFRRERRATSARGPTPGDTAAAAHG